MGVAGSWGNGEMIADLAQAGRADTQISGVGQGAPALGSEPEGADSFWGAAPGYLRTIPTHTRRGAQEETR